MWQAAVCRRTAVKAFLLGGAAWAADAIGAEAVPVPSVKFSAFADIHHNPGAFLSNAPERLAKIQQRALKEKVDFIVQLGDFCHAPAREAAFVKEFSSFQIPSRHVLGNHDCDGNTFAETLEAYGLKSGHYTFDAKGFRFVVLDTSFLAEDGPHFEKGNQYKVKGGERGFISREQLAWFRDTLMGAPCKCVVLSHQSLERDNIGVGNLPAVRKIINEANVAVPHKVPLCINGHFHRDFLRIRDGVAYFDLNSASQDWYGTGHKAYPKELCAKASLLSKTIIWNDPIHAVITLSDDGWLKIDGMTSSFFMGITPEQATGTPCFDHTGRPCTCEVLSAQLKLWE